MNLRNQSDIKWLIPISEIEPGSSAIIGGNSIAFYGIHHLALATISISFVASVLVIKEVIHEYRGSNKKVNFPIRFPLYLAIADCLWGISHFIDHMYLVTTQTYPDKMRLEEALSMNLWFFFGYQQLMHASIAAYTYLFVVRQRKLDLGHWEWKLHLSWFGFLGCTLVIFHYLGSFGCTGYWMAHDVRTTRGLILGIVIGITSTINAVCTTLGYYKIRLTVHQLQANLKDHKKEVVVISSDDVGKQVPRKTSYHTTASQCLTTYVKLASWLYCPLAVLLWINCLFPLFANAVDPVSSLFIGFVANSSGWANAYGFFHNERLKRKREIENMMATGIGLIVSQSDSTTDGNGTR